MTQSEIYTRAFAKARAHTSSYTDAEKLLLLNEAVDQFSRDIGGYEMVDYPIITAYFDLQTHFAFSLSINDGAFADVAVTDVDTHDMTGTEAAAELEDQLQAIDANFTVTWDNFAFTVTHASLDFEIASPIDTGEYVDFTGELGLSGESTSNVLVGSFPEDCTIKAPLPSNFNAMNIAVWDNRYHLSPTTRDRFFTNNATGTPDAYFIKNNFIYLYPTPTSQKKLRVEYNGYGTAWTDGGSDPGDIPSEYHMAYVYWIASQVLEDTSELSEALYLKEEYKKRVRGARVEKGRKHRSILPRARTSVTYIVSRED